MDLHRSVVRENVKAVRRGKGMGQGKGIRRTSGKGRDGVGKVGTEWEG